MVHFSEERFSPYVLLKETFDKSEVLVLKPQAKAKKYDHCSPLRKDLMFLDHTMNRKNSSATFYLRRTDSNLHDSTI